MITRRTIALIAALALAAIGCSQGSSGKPAAAPTTAAPTTAAQTTTTVPAGPAPERVGRPFKLEQTGPNGPTTLQITVKRPINCGIRGFDLPYSDVTGDPARKVLASMGMRFCRVDLTIGNVGKRTTQIDPSGFMYDTKDRQFPSEDTLAADLFEREGGNFPGVNTIELVPTRSDETLMVFAIPVGAQPALVSIEETNGEPPVVAIRAADVKWIHPRGH